MDSIQTLLKQLEVANEEKNKELTKAQDAREKAIRNLYELRNKLEYVSKNGNKPEDVKKVLDWLVQLTPHGKDNQVS